MKVWLTTSEPIYPNVYAWLCGPPGIGKNRSVRAVKRYLHELPEFHFSPTSMSDASLVDALVGSKRIITRPGMDQIEYHSMFVTAEELGAFQGKYPENIVGLLTAFYDPDPYGQERRGKEIKIKMHRPQLNMLIGVTPSNLMTWMPPFAWDQGFTSRIILVYGDDQQIIDDFETQKRPISRDLLYDLQLINGLVGEFTVHRGLQTSGG